jgi:hypothetical protein
MGQIDLEIMWQIDFLGSYMEQFLCFEILDLGANYRLKSWLLCGANRLKTPWLLYWASRLNLIIYGANRQIELEILDLEILDLIYRVNKRLGSCIKAN